MHRLHADLVACYDVIKDPQRWCQGTPVLVEDDGMPVRFCSTGVIETRAMRHERTPMLRALYLALPKASQTVPDEVRRFSLAEAEAAHFDAMRDAIETYNDTHSHSAVMRVWRRAIAHQEARLAATRRSASETELVVAGD